MNYYIAVSSFNKKQEANLLIKIPGDAQAVKGSLRFNWCRFRMNASKN